VAPRGPGAHRVQLNSESPRPAVRPRGPGGPGQGGPGGPGGTGGGQPPVTGGGLGGVVPPETTQHRSQRLVGDLHQLTPPVLVRDGHAVSHGPAREFCPCCHRTSLPNVPARGGPVAHAGESVAGRCHHGPFGQKRS
jgi:hypothetical protein